LDQINKAGSSDDILREVLGLSSTNAIWVAERLNQIVQRYAQQSLDQNALDSLRNELRELGLEQHVPKTISAVIDSKDDPN
jgi:hypothetical protein